MLWYTGWLFSMDFRGQAWRMRLSGSSGEFCTSRGVDYIRVDTDFPNKRMQHILKKTASPGGGQ